MCLRQLIMPRIRLVRTSTLITDADVRKAAAAIQKQVTRDFGPDWGRTATVTASKKHRPGDWVVWLKDTIDVDGALGYHDHKGALPYAIVDVALDKADGLSWTVTLSHEVLEMLGDPLCGLVMPYPGGRHTAYEACDAVEADNLGYLIDGVLVSDFVLQAWYTGKGTRYDFCGALKAPLTLAPGGYISVLDSSGWHQVFAAEVNGQSQSKRAARSSRRPK